MFLHAVTGANRGESANRNIQNTRNRLVSPSPTPTAKITVVLSALVSSAVCITSAGELYESSPSVISTMKPKDAGVLRSKAVPAKMPVKRSRQLESQPFQI